MSALSPLVQKYDPLLASLVGGQPHHRAAIWGQTLQESNANPAAVEFPNNPDKGGFGLWQHTGSRARDLKQFAVSLGKPWQDPEAQVRFVGHEIRPGGPEAHAWEQTQKTATVEAATETFMLDYERPAVQGGPPTYGTARLDVRVRGAKEALAAILAAKPGDEPVTDTSGVPTHSAPATANPNVLADWIRKNEVPAEAVIRQLLVAKGVPGFLIDLIFSAVNPIVDQLIQNIHPEDLGKLLVEHVIKPMLANLNVKKP